MDNGIYITLSKQLVLFRDMDVTANNIANANTTGYNSEHLLFSSYMNKDVNQGVHNPMAFAHDPNSYRNGEQGPIKVTDNPLDMAIEGKGYFSVQTPLGVRYTRAGNFTTNDGGMLVTPEGYPVLDSTGKPIEFPEDTVTIDVGAAGNIKVNNEEFANVGVFEFSNEQLLERAGNNLYKTDIAAAPATSFRVTQGTLEGSNVQPVSEMTHMISISRAVTETAKFIEIMYDLQRKAASTWVQQR